MSGGEEDPPVRYAIDVRHYRDALRDAVELPITTRGVLYVLAQWMNTDGSNARPRLSRLAASCQLRQRAVGKHLSAAVEAGYLTRTSSGHKGRTAVYRATIPGYRWDAGEGRIVQPLAVEEPAQRAHDGAAKEPKGCTGDPHRLHAETPKPAPACSPTSKQTSLLLRRRGGRAAIAAVRVSARPGDEDPFDPLRDDPVDWIEGNCDGFEAGEEAMTMNMIDQGYNLHAVLNTINKQRAG